MQKLHFPPFEYKILPAGGQEQMSKIFDTIRKKYVALTPEEWVRQHFIHFLIRQLQYPSGLMGVEKEIRIHGLKRRPDVVVFDSFADPLLIAECKAPDVNITQHAFDQAARYNLALKCKVFVITNGLVTFCCIPDQQTMSYRFLTEVPDYHQLKSLTT